MECLKVSQLQLLLSGNATSHVEGPWIAHVGVCETCQANLEAIAGPRTIGLRFNQESTSVSPSTLRSLYDLGRESPKPNFPSRPKMDSELTDLLAPSPDGESIGQFADFRVLGLLGRGGMGMVLKAIDSKLNRVVAIKILSPRATWNESSQDGGGEFVKARFLTEARAAAAIEHPNVIGIHQVGEFEGTPYIVMPCIEGQSIAEYVQLSGRFAPERAVSIAVQVCDALEAAHRQGVVHRDIKPANLLIENTTGDVKVGDFGLARVSDDPSLTSTGFVAGTPQFMSPEQACGQSVDHRTDIYSLGAVLYTMLAGKPPFDGEQALSVIYKVANDTPVAPSVAAREDHTNSSGSSIEPWLDNIVAWAMSKQPSDRPQDVSQLRTALTLKECSAPAPLPTPYATHNAGNKSTASKLSPVPTFGSLRQLGSLVAFATFLLATWFFVQWIAQSNSIQPLSDSQQDPAAPADQSATESEPPTFEKVGPFAVTTARGEETSFDNLQQACSSLQTSGEIAIRRPGDYLLTKPLFENIASGAVVELVSDFPPTPDSDSQATLQIPPAMLPFSISNFKLKVVGLHVRQQVSSEPSPSDDADGETFRERPLFRVKSGALELDGCTLQHSSTCVSLDVGSELNATRSLLATLGNSVDIPPTIEANVTRETSIDVRNSLVIGTRLVALGALTGSGGRISFHDSTWYGDQLITLHDDVNWSLRPEPVKIEARGNIFQVRYLMVAGNSNLGSIAKREVHARNQLQTALRWRGDYNLFSIGDAYYGFRLPRGPIVSGRSGFIDIERWREFCSAEGESSAEAATAVLSSNLDLSESLVESIDVGQFELARNASASDYGARVNELGPSALSEE